MLSSHIQKFSRMIEKWVSDIMSLVSPHKATSDHARPDQAIGKIHQLAAKGDLKNLKMLLSDPSVDFDSPDDEGNTPLFAAMKSGSIETIKFFLERGCQINFQNTHGQSPIFEALHSNNMDFLDQILNLENIDLHTTDESEQNILHISVLNGFVNSTLAIINKLPALKNTTDKYGKTPLMYASESGFVNIAKILLTEETDVNLCCKDGWSALMYATSKGALDIMSLLLAHGADIECRDQTYHQTSFLIASKSKNVEAAKLLIKNQARCDVADYYSRTALHLAVETHNQEMVELILTTPVSLGAKDKFGLTAREWAVVNSTSDILKKIVQAEKNRV